MAEGDVFEESFDIDLKLKVTSDAMMGVTPLLPSLFRMDLGNQTIVYVYSIGLQLPIV